MEDFVRKNAITNITKDQTVKDIIASKQNASGVEKSLNIYHLEKPYVVAYHVQIKIVR